MLSFSADFCVIINVIDVIPVKLPLPVIVIVAVPATKAEVIATMLNAKAYLNIAEEK